VIAPTASPAIIRTVLGDIEPGALKRLDYHEHLFQATRLLAGEELDDEAASRDEAQQLRDSGIGAMIEATPIGLGRNPDAVARISAATGLQIVHATGAHHSGHYQAGHWLRALTVSELTARFVEEVTDGIRVNERTSGSMITTPAPDDLPVRAGIVKAGITYWKIGNFERRVLESAAATSLVTGVGIMVHLECGSATHEILDLLGGYGVAANRVILAHVDRNLDAALHTELAARGAYLGYDGMARHLNGPDSAILDCAEAVVSSGGGDRLLLGGDVARRSRYLAYGGMPGLRYLAERFLPRLSDRIGRDAVDRILLHNPRLALAFPSEHELF